MRDVVSGETLTGTASSNGVTFANIAMNKDDIHAFIAPRDAWAVARLREAGAVVLGMVSGRAERAKCVVGLFGHNLVDGMGCAADGPQRRLKAAGRHGGVCVDANKAFARRGITDLLDELERMGFKVAVDPTSSLALLGHAMRALARAWLEEGSVGGGTGAVAVTSPSAS